MSHTRFLQGYYLGTPVFIILDLAFNAPIRVSFVESLLLRGLYYGVCVVCGLVCYMRPASAPWIGIGESSINLLLLLLSVMIPIYNVAEAAAMGGEIAVPFTTSTMINVLLCGSVLIFTFHRSEAAILGRKGGSGNKSGKGGMRFTGGG